MGARRPSPQGRELDRLAAERASVARAEGAVEVFAAEEGRDPERAAAQLRLDAHLLDERLADEAADLALDALLREPIEHGSSGCR